eukprot:TRINITY_DN1711_c0_g1_i2.p1 TRINITY_DN1711_c0_g1~~TRINITY_DN1711_c0_g1_i2.p1  ORF type:complete len:208 (+),score=46.08 TRINITY_DN1711_c0_g1_i2:79-624(+)
MEKTRKIVVLGARAVGKSAVTIQYCEQHFVDMYNPTIENTFHRTIKYKGEEYQLQVVDTAGQDEYSIFHNTYSVGVHGYVLVYSVTARNSFEMIKILNDKLLNVAGTDNVPRVIVGNKTDMYNQRHITTQQGQELAQQWGCAFVECSAKHNENIAQAFNLLMQEMEKTQGPEPQDSKCTIL